MRYTRGKNPNSRNGFKQKYKVNNDFFSSPNEINSYYAGFIAADGNVYKNRLTISVQRRDRWLLENFIKSLESNYPIFDYNSNGFPQSKIAITSRMICDDLGRVFSVTPNKSLTLLPPNITNSNFLDYYIKGILDGDGSVTFDNKKGIYISFTGTREICRFILDRLSIIIGRNLAGMEYTKKNSKNTWFFKLSDKTARIIFLHYYKLDYGLDRKWKTEYNKYCEEWRTKRFNERLYHEIYTASKTMTPKQIAKNRGTTPEAVYAIKKHHYYIEYVLNIESEG